MNDACHQSRFSSTVGSRSPTRASEKSEILPSRGTDTDVAYAERQRPVARDEQIPVLSDEPFLMRSLGSKPFLQTPSVPTVLGRLKFGTAGIMAVARGSGLM
ncbi:hypothetical protein E4U16_006440 [Claviceps sp. LM84 group G4]|nr:hypothetical protein E4U16_006440 [Claviceps sp. LM84 group G4]KAG6077397.1 hypothetical protein E4U33_001295 [Claviceps sp. LM78 group G4]